MQHGHLTQPQENKPIATGAVMLVCYQLDTLSRHPASNHDLRTSLLS